VHSRRLGGVQACVRADSAGFRLGDAPAGEGVGLGLAVARGLTEAMGGTVTVLP
jgi:signal transduction histidine kinase